MAGFGKASTKLSEKTYKTEVKIEMNNKDVTTNLTPYLLDFSYSDTDAEAEDIQIQLQNRERLWFKEWFPERGTKIKTEIVIHDEAGDEHNIPCGEFEIDEVEAKGAPNVVTLKGISALVTGEMKDTARSQSWEKAKFKKIVDEIAKRHKYKTIYNIIKEKEYDAITQNDKSDIEFLFEICEAESYGLKIEDKTIIITEEAFYEQEGPLFTIHYLDKDEEKKGKNPNKGFSLLDFDLKKAALDSYTAAELTYKDPKTGKTYKAKVGNVKEKVTEKILKLNDKVKSNEEAKEVCEKALEKENKKTNPAKFTIAPRFPIAAKTVLAIKGFGTFDGQYLINSVNHNVSVGSGYVVDLDCTKFIPGENMLVFSREKKEKEKEEEFGSAGELGSAQGAIDFLKKHIGTPYSQNSNLRRTSHMDCSSAIMRAGQDQGWLPKGKGYNLTTASMPNDPNFVKVSWDDLQPGDVVWRPGHVEMYVGDGKTLGAHKPGTPLGYSVLKRKPPFTRVYRFKKRIQQASFSKGGSLSAGGSGKLGSSRAVNPVGGGRISSGFGYRIHPVTRTRSFHAGIDLPKPRGTPIKAAWGGVVTHSGPKGSYGNLVIIKHPNGMESRYAHCSSLKVKKGQKVNQGQVVGGVGKTGRSTGNHLHFEVRKNGKPVNPKNYI